MRVGKREETNMMVVDGVSDAVLDSCLSSSWTEENLQEQASRNGMKGKAKHGGWMLGRGWSILIDDRLPYDIPAFDFSSS